MPDPITRLNAALEGRYRIERELGEGGMATVYLADDLRHERKVALKVLKPELAAVVGAERFLAEIKTTANLQHPHILPLFDSGEADGFLFYVMPYIEGETLRERIDREKQLPVDEALGIATAVANALQTAHDAGVIHRDIKPGNILLSRGEPLVADFGIALAVGAAGGSRLTETGLSVGTPYYMSPEQATGDQMIGPAADTYALACVLYEMLVGEPPYLGNTAQAVLGKIIQGVPVSATAVRKAVPSNVDAAIRRGLEKLPADRFTGAREFAKALADPGFRYGEEVGIGPPLRRGVWNPLSAAATGLAILATGVAGWSLLRPAAPQPVVRFELGVPDSLALFGNNGLQLAISPDGSRIVFVGSTPGGGRPLWLRPLDQLSSAPIPGTEAALNPRFSPDGQSIAFRSEDGGLSTVSLSGAPPLTLVPDSVSNGAFAWGPDGMIYFPKAGVGGTTLWRVSANGGEPESVTTLGDGERGHLWPDALPNGKGILFTKDIGAPTEDEIAVLSFETGEVSTLFLGATARYVRSGHIVYTSGDGVLFGRPFDVDRLEPTGPARTLLEGVQVNVASPSYFAVSETGVLVYRPGAVTSLGGIITITWAGRDGSAEAVDPQTLVGNFATPRLSPDGRRIAIANTPAGDTESQIWVYDLDQRTFTPLTFVGNNERPFWSPDGAEVGFLSDREGAIGVYTQPWDRSLEARLIRAAPDGNVREATWTPDGSRLVFEAGQGNGGDLYYAPAHPDSAAVVLLDTPFNESVPSVSPDGRWLAYESNESGQYEVYVRPFPGPGGQTPVSVGGGSTPVWAYDGREIVYEDTNDTWWVAAVQTDPTFAVESRDQFASSTDFATQFQTRQYDISPDGQRLVGGVLGGNLEAVVGQAGRDVVVLNFFEVLRERMGN